eukprot:TRINITY_DN4427_c1_g1_i1.p1 TRINITY_DN4427_c1_g1~~TRINITY_DN4427_c1_g1_i1.p1  ORF type:complete len:630 (+),score=131.25 TRINITY_DN4427_c1_g1_i1:61-1950(+)
MSRHALPLSRWSVRDVCSWLPSAVVGVDMHVETFRRQQIDGGVLVSLSEAELRDDLGIAELGLRRAIVGAVRQLRLESLDVIGGRTVSPRRAAHAATAEALSLADAGAQYRIVPAARSPTHPSPRSPPHQIPTTIAPCSKAPRPLSVAVSAALRPAEPAAQNTPPPRQGSAPRDGPANAHSTTLHFPPPPPPQPPPAAPPSAPPVTTARVHPHAQKREQDSPPPATAISGFAPASTPAASPATGSTPDPSSAARRWAHISVSSVLNTPVDSDRGRGRVASPVHSSPVEAVPHQSRSASAGTAHRPTQPRRVSSLLSTVPVMRRAEVSPGRSEPDAGSVRRRSPPRIVEPPRAVVVPVRADMHGRATGRRVPMSPLQNGGLQQPPVVVVTPHSVTERRGQHFPTLSAPTAPEPDHATAEPDFVSAPLSELQIRSPGPSRLPTTLPATRAPSVTRAAPAGAPDSSPLSAPTPPSACPPDDVAKAAATTRTLSPPQRAAPQRFISVTSPSVQRVRLHGDGCPTSPRSALASVQRAIRAGEQTTKEELQSILLSLDPSCIVSPGSKAAGSPPPPSKSSLMIECGGCGRRAMIFPVAGKSWCASCETERDWRFVQDEPPPDVRRVAGDQTPMEV